MTIDNLPSADCCRWAIDEDLLPSTTTWSGICEPRYVKNDPWYWQVVLNNEPPSDVMFWLTNGYMAVGQSVSRDLYPNSAEKSNAVYNAAWPVAAGMLLMILKALDLASQWSADTWGGLSWDKDIEEKVPSARIPLKLLMYWSTSFLPTFCMGAFLSAKTYSQVVEVNLSSPYWVTSMLALPLAVSQACGVALYKSQVCCCPLWLQVWAAMLFPYVFLAASLYTVIAHGLSFKAFAVFNVAFQVSFRWDLCVAFDIFQLIGALALAIDICALLIPAIKGLHCSRRARRARPEQTP